MRLRTSKHIHIGVYIERADTEIARKLPDVWVCEERRRTKSNKALCIILPNCSPTSNNTKLIIDAPTRSREIKLASF